MNQSQQSPHVGVTYQSHGAARAPADQQQWWGQQWWVRPSWGYQYGYPWYGMQSQCYFDPWTGAWVCPGSPWAYQPAQQQWFQPRPYYSPQYSSRAVFSLR